jgi:uncharacterized coiled-coil protein SlyX
MDELASIIWALDKLNDMVAALHERQQALIGRVERLEKEQQAGKRLEKRIVTLENKVATLNEFMMLQNEGNKKVTYALDMLNEMAAAVHKRQDTLEADLRVVSNRLAMRLSGRDFPSENSSEAP